MSKQAVEEIKKAERQAQEMIESAKMDMKKAKTEAEDKINALYREFVSELRLWYDAEIEKVNADFAEEIKAERAKAEELLKKELEKYKMIEDKAVSSVIDIVLK